MSAVQSAIKSTFLGTVESTVVAAVVAADIAADCPTIGAANFATFLSAVQSAGCPTELATFGNADKPSD